MVKLSTLVGIAGATGMVTALTGYTLNSILQNKVKQSPVYKEAMKIINDHAASEKFLGRPVKSKTIDLGNQNNILSLKISSLELPVYGPKNSGLLYVWADRMSEDDPWNIFKLELELLDEDGGKMSIINKSPILLNPIGQNP